MVIAGLELVEVVGNLALFVDQEALAVNAVILLAHELLRTPDAKGIGDGVILIGQQGEVKLIALFELFQALGRIRADTEHHHIEGGQLGVDIAQAAGLGGAAGGHRLGIEVDQHFFAAQGGELQRIAVLVGQSEVGGGAASL